MRIARLERKIDSDDLPEPRKKIWQTLTAQSGISIAGDGDGAGGVNSKRGVFESPRLGTDHVAGVVLWGTWMNAAANSRDFGHEFARSEVRVLAAVALSLITRSGGVSPTRVETRT